MLLFFSKRLNLYVYSEEDSDNYYVKYLNDGNDIRVGFKEHTDIKSIKI